MAVAVMIASERGKVGLPAGVEMLRGGGSAMDAVEAAVRDLESNSDDHWVGGGGGLPNLLGVVELDASIMDGRTRPAGAGAAVRGYAHPISIARLVMERLGQHVLLCGEGAEGFAAEMGLAQEHLLTDEARRMWREGLSDPGCGFVEGHLPVGLQLAAGRGQEALLLSVAHRAYERRAG